jgi:hypothetical protein
LFFDFLVSTVDGKSVSIHSPQRLGWLKVGLERYDSTMLRSSTLGVDGSVDGRLSMAPCGANQREGEAPTKPKLGDLQRLSGSFALS